MRLLDPGTKAWHDGSPLPPVPVPTGPNDLPPDQSERKTLGTSTLRQGLWFDSKDTGDQGWINETECQPYPDSQYFFSGWADGSGPPQYTLTLRRYWARGTYVALKPGQSFAQEYAISYGISITESQTFSAELGVEVSGISAKLSATFERSVTVESASTATKTFSLTAPAGQDLVWVLWQLIDEVVPLDGQGNPLERYVGDGYWSNFPAPFPVPSAHGAWIYLSPTNTPVGATIPHDAFYSSQTLFPAAAQ